MDTNGNQLSDNDNSTINHRNKHKAEGRTQLNINSNATNLMPLLAGDYRHECQWGINSAG